MLKRLGVALAALFSFVQLASAAGTIPFSLSQQFDALGKPLGGCRLYTIAAGTVSTPQDAFQDADLTMKLPNPIECDASGRLPQFFLADGNIKVRLTDKNGVTQIVADNILVIGPSSGGGGGGGGQVDPTTIIQTGDVKYRYGTGSLSGFVRANGRTIGSASSGASERANADCQALFEYLWGADASLVVSGGRGASAAADWAANKTIALPDFRGRVLAGLDDMGETSAGRLSEILSSTVLGSSGGSKLHTLTAAQIPWHTHSGTTESSGGAFTYSFPNSIVGQLEAGGNPVTVFAGTVATLPVGDRFHAHNFTTNGGNGVLGQAHPIVQPTSVVTLYIKL